MVVVGVCATAALAAFVTSWLASRSLALAFIVAACGLIAIWGVFPRPDRKVSRRVVLLLGAFTFASLLPGVLAAALQALVLLGAFANWMVVPSVNRRGRAIVLWSAAVIAFWAALALHPNVPDLSTGALGVRKSILAVAGVVLGCSVLPPQRRNAELLAVRLLGLALGVSILGYLFFPGLEAVVQRDADVSTGQFGGQARLQGVFAGPFHVSMAAAFLVGWSVLRSRVHRLTALVVGPIGLMALSLALVRTGYIAVLAIPAVAVLISPSAGARARRIAFVLLAGVVFGSLGANYIASSGAVSSIANISSDTRFLNRLPTYEEALDLIFRSPLYGWGAGSAGDTMGYLFGTSREHVTPHNIVLKMAVEGGAIGLLLWGGWLLSLARHVRFRSSGGQSAATALTIFAVFGMTISAIDALPVTYILLFVVGLAVGDVKDRTRIHPAADSRGATPFGPPRSETLADRPRQSPASLTGGKVSL